MMTLGMEIDGALIPLVAIVGGLCVAVVGMVTGTIQRISKTKAREQTRREVAAYVAEGSMSAEEGERLLRAGLTAREQNGGGCC
jgi:hypothetical protein